MYYNNGKVISINNNITQINYKIEYKKLYIILYKLTIKILTSELLHDNCFYANIN